MKEDINDFYQGIKKRYELEVKPNLEKNPRYASIEFSMLRDILNTRKEEIQNYHSGIDLLSTIDILNKEFIPTNHSEKEIISYIVQTFEMYFNQVELSIKSNNIYDKDFKPESKKKKSRLEKFIKSIDEFIKNH